MAGEGPPRITDVIRRVQFGDDEEDRAWFEDLIQKTVPESAWDILQLDGEWEKVLAFAAEFSLQHFPLHQAYLEWYAESQEDESEDERQSPYRFLRDGLPFQLMGFSWEEYNSMWSLVEKGISAFALLPAVPPNGYHECREMRQDWLESAASEIPEETLKRIPEGGIPLEQLERAVRGTPVEAAHLAGRWIWGKTGNIFLDDQFPEDFEYNFNDGWDDQTIEYAGGEWKKAKKILTRVGQLTEWLEEDLPERFREMLDLVTLGLEKVPESPLESSSESSREER